MIMKTPVGIAFGLVGFIGYCIYFDRKRRADPDFKKKLRERKCELLFFLLLLQI